MDCLTILIFDVDDTLLKEVPVTAIDKPNVQTLKYKPSEYSAKKYRERLVTRDASKVIHYEFVSDDTIISTVKINPKFEHMESIRSIADKCYLASANDDNRTRQCSNSYSLADTHYKNSDLNLYPERYL